MADIVRLDERRKRPLIAPQVLLDDPIEFTAHGYDAPAPYVVPEPAVDPIEPVRRGRIPSFMFMTGALLSGLGATGLLYGVIIYAAFGVFPYALLSIAGFVAGVALLAAGIFIHLHD